MEGIGARRTDARERKERNGKQGGGRYRGGQQTQIPGGNTVCEERCGSDASTCCGSDAGSEGTDSGSESESWAADNDLRSSELEVNVKKQYKIENQRKYVQDLLSLTDNKHETIASKGDQDLKQNIWKAKKMNN